MTYMCLLYIIYHYRREAAKIFEFLCPKMHQNAGFLSLSSKISLCTRAKTDLISFVRVPFGLHSAKKTLGVARISARGAPKHQKFAKVPLQKKSTFIKMSCR